MTIQNTYTPMLTVKVNRGQSRLRQWFNTPNFGALPSDSKPVNPYTDANRRFSQTDYSAWTIRNSDGFRTTVVPNGPIFTHQQLDIIIRDAFTNFAYEMGQSVGSNENSSMLKALGKVSDAKVNLAVAFAEATKTSDLILQTANRLDRAYRAFRKGRLGDVAKLLDITPKRVHKTWLSYKYGWMPLLMDVKGAAEFFAQQHIGRPTRFVVSSVQNAKGTKSRNVPYWPFDAAQTQLAYHAERLVWTTQAKTKIWCELTYPLYSEMQQLGLTNPALFAWELIPFSFVFDWFISVGDWLTAMTALNGVTVRRVMQTSWYDSNFFRNTPATVRTDGFSNYYESGLDLSLNLKEFGRGAPSVNPLLLYPPRTNSFSFQKMVTSLALIRGNYRGSSLRT